MTYDLVWERLNEAVRRVMDATGCSKEEAQADICRAVADGVIRISEPAEEARHRAYDFDRCT